MKTAKINLPDSVVDDILREFDDIGDDDAYDDDLPQYRQSAQYIVPEVADCPESYPFARNARILLGCCQHRACGQIPCDGSCKRRNPRFGAKYK